MILEQELLVGMFVGEKFSIFLPRTNKIEFIQKLVIEKFDRARATEGN